MVSSSQEKRPQNAREKESVSGEVYKLYSVPNRNLEDTKVYPLKNILLVKTNWEGNAINIADM